MTGTTWALLRDLLVERYADFKARLTRQFGSEEPANATLQQTWLHLQRQSETGSVPRSGESGPVRNPPAFLVRVAANIAKDVEMCGAGLRSAQAMLAGCHTCFAIAMLQ